MVVPFQTMWLNATNCLIGNLILANNQTYSLQFNLAVHDFGLVPWLGSSFKVYISKNHMEYKDKANECTTDYTNYKNYGDKIEVANINLSASLYTYNEWQTFTITFNTPSDGDEYDYINFDLRQNNYIPNNTPNVNCRDGYVLVDDINLTNACNNDCYDPDRIPFSVFWVYQGIPIYLVNDAPDWAVGYDQSGNYHALSLYIQGATYIKLEIWDGFGGLMYEVEEYDPVELINPGWPDFYLAWDKVCK